VNFFEEQDRARRKTGLLAVYFLAAVTLIALGINAAAFCVARYSGLHPGNLDAWLERPYWLWITGATLLIIGFGSALTLLKLRGGGEAIAHMVGARRARHQDAGPEEQRLINVVEEMSIAAGTPAPTVYVMDGEAGINAFVAGLRPTEAVLVVTRGALQELSRDELQGVVGHEYSHVLNGDMRLNIQLLGVLAGILLIGQLGGFVLRSLRYSGRRRARVGGQAVLFALGLGLALFVIGYVGLFFGRLIKAAISRQREFLADASSVQFTRNPAGIAGALWKIEHHAGGSLLGNAHAEDMSHMCFGQSLKVRFQSWLATHPPLDVRIKRVDPAFTARRLSERLRSRAAGEPAPSSAGEGSADAGVAFAAAPEAAAPTSAADIAHSIGNPSVEHMIYAQRLHGALSPALLAKVRGIPSAKAVIYGLLLAGTDDARLPVARALIDTSESRSAADDALALRTEIRRLGAAARLPVVDLAIPALRSLGRAERKRFLALAQDLVRVDRRFTLFEFALLTILRRQLAAARRDDKVKYYKYAPVLAEIRLLLTVLARAGAKDATEARTVFQRVMGSFTREPGEPAGQAACTPAALTHALGELALLSPLLKGSLITACADCVLHDGRVLPIEAELLRATALSLDCPMPPLTPARAA
jgi:Zn-dependent protease with chaperone function